MCGGGFHEAGYDPHDIIQEYVQRFSMRASAPYWSGILCAAVWRILAFASSVDPDRHSMKLNSLDCFFPSFIAVLLEVIHQVCSLGIS